MDIEKLVNGLRAILVLIFGDPTPPLLGQIIGVVLAAAVLIYGTYGLLLGVTKIRQLWRSDVLPIFYDPASRRRAARRRRFADHVESEIRRLNNQEEWRDHRYAELEAEVEAEGRRRTTLTWRPKSQLRRERSLSRALTQSDERLVLLEGEPGAGKSVALRHVAKRLASSAMRARTTQSIVPLYINLKTLDRHPARRIDASLIEEYVLRVLNRTNSRDVEEFLVEEFAAGLRDGTWLFLFDSFDEIPDILSTTGAADEAVRAYAEAIADFLGGMNHCRGVVASRHFRGPGGMAWPRFRILRLSDSYRRNLIKRADLPLALERLLVGRLELAPQEIVVMAANPLFLGLLCEYVRTTALFPDNTHMVFETYISSRLRRDADKVQRRFGVDVVDVRHAAEMIAFAMASVPRLGLSVKRQELIRIMVEVPKVVEALDALEFIKLGRADEMQGDAAFTFAHRRFQEYFATCVVLREPTRVTVEQLLTDGRWRETAVTLLQLQAKDDLAPLLAAAEARLHETAADVAGTLEPTAMLARQERSSPGPVEWPTGILHLLSLLQSGMSGRLGDLSVAVRDAAARILLKVWFTGTLADRKWALEVAGIVETDVMARFVGDSFSSRSRWLAETALRQVRRLERLSPELDAAVREHLVFLYGSGRLQREQESTRALLSTVPESHKFLKLLHLLKSLPIADLACHAMALLIASVAVGTQQPEAIAVAATLTPLSLFAPKAVAGRMDNMTAGGIASFLARAFVTFMLSLALLLADVSGALVVTMPLLLAWSIVALVAVTKGRTLNVLLWPLLVFWPLAILWGGRRVLVTVAAVLSTVVALVIMVSAGVLFLLIRVPEEVLGPAGAVVGGVFVVGFLVLAIRNAGRSLRDLASYIDALRSVRGQGACVSADELVARLGGFSRPDTRVRFVRSLRQRDLICNTKRDERLIREVALRLESGIYDGVAATLDDIALLDELQMLAERLAATRTVPSGG